MSWPIFSVPPQAEKPGVWMNVRMEPFIVLSDVDILKTRILFSHQSLLLTGKVKEKTLY